MMINVKNGSSRYALQIPDNQPIGLAEAERFIRLVIEALGFDRETVLDYLAESRVIKAVEEFKLENFSDPRLGK